MTDKEKQEWLKVKYPLTIIADRYDGTYSGASWLAFPLYCDEIPPAVDGYDEDCAQFWKDYKEPVGKGAYASDAVTDLIRQMREFKPEESEDERIRKTLVRYFEEKLQKCYEWKEGIPNRSVLDWLEKQKEQKQEDLPAGFYFIDQDGNKYYSKEFRYNNGTFTTTLKVQDEQKPAEWSEEDEHRLKLIRQCIVSCPSISGVDGNEVELLEFLDSLRSCPKKSDNWKPSEEQMVAFRSYIKDFQARAEAAVGGWNNFDVMIRLFEQLKKL